MKITHRFYSMIYLIPLLCMGHLCCGDDQSSSLKKMKQNLISEEFSPNAMVTKTNDTNRAEIVSDLKRILNESIADPTAPQSVNYAGRAIIAYAAVTKEDSATVSATLKPFLSYPDPDVQRLALRVIAQNGDSSASGLLKSKLQEAESNLPDASAFTAQTEKQYQPAFRAYFETLLIFGKIKTPEAAQLRDESLARFKAKYQGTDYGPKLIEAYNEGLKRQSQRPDPGP